MRYFSQLLPRSVFMMLALGAPLTGIAANVAGRSEKSWVASQRASAAEMISKLDMTSFPNSIGPRRTADKKTLAQYGFTKRSIFDDGWAYAKMGDGSWEFGVFVLTDGDRTKTLCVTDSAVGGGTYHVTTAVEVKREPDGFWESSKVLPHAYGCS